MPALMQQLQDIEGLDAISVWPLAIGWWALIALGALFLGTSLWLLKSRLRYLKSWQKDAFNALDTHERNLSSATSRETVAFLSEFLRRIAVRRFPRKECAGLTGEAWLQWLKANDPKQFDWVQKGTLLVDIPYSPVATNLPLQQVKELIQAVRNWVC